jgi:hypothetical protein
MKFLLFFAFLPCLATAQNDADAVVTSVDIVSTEDGTYIFHCTVRNTSDKIKNVTFQVGQIWKDVSQGANVQTFVMEDMKLAANDKQTLSIIKDDTLKIFKLRLAPHSESKLLLMMTCRNKGFLAFEKPENLKPTSLVVKIDPKKPEVRPDMDKSRRCFLTSDIVRPLSTELDLKNMFIELVMDRFEGQCQGESRFDSLKLITMKNKISNQILQKLPEFQLNAAPMDLGFEFAVDDRSAPITFHKIQLTQNGTKITMLAEMCFGQNVAAIDMQDFKDTFPCIFK